MDPTAPSTQTPRPADGQAQPTPEAADAAKADAAKADAAKADAAKADAAKADAAKADAAKAPRRRRGPPADGRPEKRALMVLTTSKLSDTNGVRLRRGRLVAVPERRIESLVAQGRIRKASAEEAEVLTRRYGEPAQLA